MEKCNKIVDEKYYQTTFLGLPLNNHSRYFVLDDGSQVSAFVADRYPYFHDPAFHTLCKTEFVPKGGKK